MEKKYKFIVFGTVLLILIAAIASAWIRFNENKQMGKVLKINEAFVADWGSHDYNDFDGYLKKVKPYMQESLYKEYFADEQSWELRKGRLTTKKYIIETKPIEVISKERRGNTFTITTKVREKITSVEENKSTEKRMTVIYIKDDESYLVNSIKYNQ